MKFAEAQIPGVWVIDPIRLDDERGFFARTFEADRFAELGLDTSVLQCSVSYNIRAGTLRGVHYQVTPHGESKLIRCTRGAIYDVLLDLRPESPAYCRWVAIELSAENGRSVFAPAGVAHGFQTLADATEVYYQMSQPFVPEAAQGVRWDDPTFAIDWPPAERIISDRDRSYQDFTP